jgi:hypothetical protein
MQTERPHFSQQVAIREAPRKAQTAQQLQCKVTIEDHRDRLAQNCAGCHANEPATRSNDQNAADEPDRHSRQGNEIGACEILRGY